MPNLFIFPRGNRLYCALFTTVLLCLNNSSMLLMCAVGPWFAPGYGRGDSLKLYCYTWTMLVCWWCGHQGTWSSQPAQLQPHRWEWGRPRSSFPVVHNHLLSLDHVEGKVVVLAPHGQVSDLLCMLYMLSRRCWWSVVSSVVSSANLMSCAWPCSHEWTGSTGGDWARTPEGPQCWGSVWQMCCYLPLTPGGVNVIVTMPEHIPVCASKTVL